MAWGVFDGAWFPRREPRLFIFARNFLPVLYICLARYHQCVDNANLPSEEAFRDTQKL